MKGPELTRWDQNGPEHTRTTDSTTNAAKGYCSIRSERPRFAASSQWVGVGGPMPFEFARNRRATGLEWAGILGVLNKQIQTNTNNVKQSLGS